MQYAKINSVGTGQNFNSLNEMLGFFGFENESIAIRNFAMRGDTKSIKHLLEFDVDIFQKSSNKDDKGCNIAHAAALANQPEVLEYLHEIKADLNVLNDNHSTPLHVAASFLNLEAIKQLVIAKADLNMVNRDNLTPLDLAWNSSIHKSSNRSDFDENKFQHILSLLINNGAKHSLKQDNPSGPPLYLKILNLALEKEDLTLSLYIWSNFFRGKSQMSFQKSFKGLFDRVAAATQVLPKKLPEEMHTSILSFCFGNINPSTKTSQELQRLIERRIKKDSEKSKSLPNPA